VLKGTVLSGRVQRGRTGRAVCADQYTICAAQRRAVSIVPGGCRHMVLHWLGVNGVECMLGLGLRSCW
jgi:hypothetical protein